MASNRKTGTASSGDGGSEGGALRTRPTALISRVANGVHPMMRVPRSGTAWVSPTRREKSGVGFWGEAREVSEVSAGGPTSYRVWAKYWRTACRVGGVDVVVVGLSGVEGVHGIKGGEGETAMRERRSREGVPARREVWDGMAPTSRMRERSVFGSEVESVS